MVFMGDEIQIQIRFGEIQCSSPNVPIGEKIQIRCQINGTFWQGTLNFVAEKVPLGDKMPMYIRLISFLFSNIPIFLK